MTGTTRSALLVAGEASGDRAAARVAACLHEVGVPTFGLGGAACAGAGVETCARVEEHGAMGMLDVAARASSIVRSMSVLRAAAKARRPRVAILVNYTEFNTRLAAALRPLGARIVWYAAPQIWAWRAGRGRRVARLVDTMAVVLPFEEAMWRGHGVDARYVGHPSLEAAGATREHARAALGIAAGASAVALLPGSRSHEVRRLLPAMLEAAGALHARRDVEAHLMLSDGLDAATRRRAHDAARTARVPVHVHGVPVADGAAATLRAFDAVLCASGTASLEAAVANAPPVVAYKIDFMSALVARALVRTPHIALPNVLLDRRAFPELLQRRAQGDAMAIEVERLLAGHPRAAALADCAAVRAVLGDVHEPSRRVADMACAWL